MSNSPQSQPKTIDRADLHIPHHLALICDGNRRWARAHGLPSFEGHRRGIANTIRVAEFARELGIHTLTLWCFSTENWNRSKVEISYLMKIFNKTLEDWVQDAIEKQVRIIHLGRKDHLPKYLLKRLADAEERTRHNSKYVLNLAMDYGGADEAERAVEKLLDSVTSLEEAKKLLEQGINRWLDTGDQPYPNPELIIRTSGEQRMSGFMPLQSAYAEYYFCPKNLPDFDDAALLEALADFTTRDRRFGGNSSLA